MRPLLGLFYTAALGLALWLSGYASRGHAVGFALVRMFWYPIGLDVYVVLAVLLIDFFPAYSSTIVEFLEVPLFLFCWFVGATAWITVWGSVFCLPSGRGRPLPGCSGAVRVSRYWSVS